MNNGPIKAYLDRLYNFARNNKAAIGITATTAAITAGNAIANPSASLTSLIGAAAVTGAEVTGTYFGGRAAINYGRATYNNLKRKRGDLRDAALDTEGDDGKLVDKRAERKVETKRARVLPEQEDATFEAEKQGLEKEEDVAVQEEKSVSEPKQGNDIADDALNAPQPMLLTQAVSQEEDAQPMITSSDESSREKVSFKIPSRRKYNIQG